jgi:hypothetical protein
MSIHWIAAAAMAASAIATSVSAEEQSLRFRVVLTKVSTDSLEVANQPGRTLTLERVVGVAVFEDGRIAFKVVTGTVDGTAEQGSYAGYATYTFESGDSITVKYGGEWPSNAPGTAEVLSGTGAYEGVTGTAQFTTVEDPWADANIDEGTFTINVPSS